MRPTGAEHAPDAWPASVRVFFQRNKEADNDACQRRVNAGLQYRRPQHCPDQNIYPSPSDAAQVQQRQHGNRERRHAQRDDRKIAGIKQCDNNDGAGSSMIASAIRKIFSASGTRLPNSASTPSAKAISVAAGIAQPSRVTGSE